MDISQAPFVWVMPDDYRHLERLIQGMGDLRPRGQDWDYVGDGKGLVKFGFTSEAVQSRFRAMLRHCEASEAGADWRRSGPVTSAAALIGTGIGLLRSLISPKASNHSAP